MSRQPRWVYGLYVNGSVLLEPPRPPCMVSTARPRDNPAASCLASLKTRRATRSFEVGNRRRHAETAPLSKLSA